MQYAETIRIHSCRSMPVAEFLEKNELVEQQAAENGQRPIDWLAASFCPTPTWMKTSGTGSSVRLARSSRSHCCGTR